MPEWSTQLRSSYVFLIAGAFLIIYGVVSTCTGKVSSRFRWVYRDREPADFWWLVAACYAGGAIFIGIYLYQGW